MLHIMNLDMAISFLLDSSNPHIHAMIKDNNTETIHSRKKQERQ